VKVMAEMHITAFSLDLHGPEVDDVLNSPPSINRNDHQDPAIGLVFHTGES